jgi:BirA family biotin operon repressor/biotin-[acetyl-CoA-carboxylase] ligase
VPEIDPLVRWPNDVEVGGRKIAGILVEALSGGRAVFGVGVNTTGSSAGAPAEIAARLVTIPDLVGTSLPRGRLLQDFLPRLLALLTATAADPAALLPRHHARSSLDGQVVSVHRGGERLTGICRGIAIDGALLLDTAAGRVVVRSGSLTPPEQVWRGGPRP